MKNTKKTANKLPEPYKVRKGFRFYCADVAVGCPCARLLRHGLCRQ